MTTEATITRYIRIDREDAWDMGVARICKTNWDLLAGNAVVECQDKGEALMILSKEAFRLAAADVERNCRYGNETAYVLRCFRFKNPLPISYDFYADASDALMDIKSGVYGDVEEIAPGVYACYEF